MGVWGLGWGDGVFIGCTLSQRPWWAAQCIGWSLEAQGVQNIGPNGSMCMGSSEELMSSTDHILRREID